MDKQKAMKELQELMERAKALEAIIQAPDVIESYQGVFLVTPEGNATKQTFYLNVAGEIASTVGVTGRDLQYGLAFASRKDAERYQRLLEVQQKARVAMANAWQGKEKPKWVQASPVKHILVLVEGEPIVDTGSYIYRPYHFPCNKTASDFLQSLTKEDAVLLLKGMDE